jgi:hypothetical protein
MTLPDWPFVGTAWLWSGRQSTVASPSAAAVHGSKWIDRACPPSCTDGARGLRQLREVVELMERRG